METDVGCLFFKGFQYEIGENIVVVINFRFSRGFSPNSNGFRSSTKMRTDVHGFLSVYWFFTNEIGENVVQKWFMIIFQKSWKEDLVTAILQFVEVFIWSSKYQDSTLACQFSTNMVTSVSLWKLWPALSETTTRFGHKMTIMYLQYRNGCKNHSVILFWVVSRLFFHNS